MIRFACQQCGSEFSVADEFAGQKARCKKCGAIFTVAAAPAASPAGASNGAGKPSKQAKTPATAAARSVAQPRPARSAQQPPPRGTTRPPVVRSPAASTADPLGGFNIDLGALAALEAPALAAMPAAPLGGGMSLGGMTLGHKYTKKKKNGRLLLWLVFSGTSLAAVSIVAILIVTLLSLPSSIAFPDNPTAYLPADSPVAASIRLRKLFDRLSSIPQFKTNMDRALSDAASSGFDPRDLDELFVASDGTIGLVVIRLSRPLDPAALKGSVATGSSHQGLPIYLEKTRRRPRPGRPAPTMETLYLVRPRPLLFIMCNNEQRLRAALDQAAQGRGGTTDLPTGRDVALRIKDLDKFARFAELPPSAGGGDLIGLAGTLDLNDTISLDAQIDMKDAQKAAELDQKIKSTLQMLATLSKQGQPGMPDLSSAIRVSVAGAQLRVSAAVQASQLSSLAASVPGMPPNR